jgi:hypothetical protein
VVSEVDPLLGNWMFPRSGDTYFAGSFRNYAYAKGAVRLRSLVVSPM